MTQTTKLHKQRGVTLIESLIAILLFSIGILAIVGMYANSIAIAADGQYRLEASNHANRILNRMAIEADYTNQAALAASLESYVHQPTTDGYCEFSGDASDHEAVEQWVTSIQQDGSGLPGVEDEHLQITFDEASNNLVTVTVCWQAPTDNAPRREAIAMNLHNIN